MFSLSARSRQAIVTAQATPRLSRWMLWGLCLIYIFSGLFGRDPWKNDDAAGFGVMWTLAHGEAVDWFLPHLGGRSVTQAGPLLYWFGAASIRLLGGLFGEDNAARLICVVIFGLSCVLVWQCAYRFAHRSEVQPFEFVFGGQASPSDYGRTLADGALLIFIACAGLAQRLHETSVGSMVLLSSLGILYAASLSLDRHSRAGVMWGCAGAVLCLSTTPVMAALIVFGVLLGLFRSVPDGEPVFIRTPITAVFVGAILAMMIWGGLAIISGVSYDAWIHYVQAWWLTDWRLHTQPSMDVWVFILRNLPLYAWPVWPLTLWALLRWPGRSNAPQYQIPFMLLGVMLLGVLTKADSTDAVLMGLIAPMVMLATFALPTLRQGMISAIDWFSLITASLIGGFVWIVWLAKQTGFPEQTTRNIYRLLPGLSPQFNGFALLFAILVTVAWALIVRWRLVQRRQALWRCVVISAAGTTLTWVLMMTLWLPTIDYAKTYRGVVLQAMDVLPKNYGCVDVSGLGDAQLASFLYFGHLNIAKPGEHCEYALQHERAEHRPPKTRTGEAWTLIWEGRRPADRDERLRMYRLQNTFK